MINQLFTLVFTNALDNVGAQVHVQAQRLFPLVGHYAAAHPAAAFEHGHVKAHETELTGGGQPRQPGADHDYAFPVLQPHVYFFFAFF
jgi:hypothetical protein